MPPTEILEALSLWFPSNEIYAQVATTSNGRPHVRTMMLQGFAHAGNPLFFTINTTQKWRDLTADPHIAVCFVDQQKGQIIAEGSARLMAASDAQDHWNGLQQKLRRLYLPEPEAEAPSNFGVIEVCAERWEILHFNPNDYLRSRRCEFVRQGNGWQEKPLQPS